MMKAILLSLAALILFSAPAKARSTVHPGCNVIFPCDLSYASRPAQPRPRAARVRVHHTYRAVARRTQEAPPPRREASGPVHVLTGIVSGLAEKINEIVEACGSKVISAVRHTYIAGTHRISLHASGRAVDVAGNPGCIYSHLQGWPGGYSIDYAAVQHVHISLGGREDGCRFVHGGGHHAHRRRHRHRSR